MWNNHGVRRLRASFLVGVGEEGLFFLHPPPPTLTDILICFTYSQSCKEEWLPCSWRGIKQGLSINVFFFLLCNKQNHVITVMFTRRKGCVQ